MAAIQYGYCESQSKEGIERNLDARVQERKSGHLYPCGARNLTREGYRRAKMVICTRKHVGNQHFTGTEGQKCSSQQKVDTYF